MKLAGLLLLSALAFGQPQKIKITGTFRNPDNTSVNGVLVVSPSQVSATFTCGGQTALSLGTVTTRITNAVLGPLQLYPSVCLAQQNGGSVTGVALSGSPSGYSGTCVATFSGAGMVMPATGTCTFSGGVPIFTLKTYGVYKSTTTPTLTFSCNPACNSAQPPVIAVTFTKGQLYNVQVASSDGAILYATSWSVPDGTTVDVSQLQ